MAELPDSGDAVVDTALDGIRDLFKGRAIEEIVCVRSNEVRIEAEGKWQVKKSNRWNLDYWLNLSRVLANSNGLAWDEDDPRVSCRLPGGHRYEFFGGKSVEEGISLAIRVKTNRPFTLADFGLSADREKAVVDAVVRGDNILISGGTSSGKTALANTMLRHLPAHERVLIAEDTPELVVNVANTSRYLVGRHGGKITYSDVFDHLMRARPDRVLLGELSVPNAFPSLLFLNNGHKGFLTTLHSNSPREALETAVWLRTGLAGHRIEQSIVTEFLSRNVDLVIQVHRRQGKRTITDIVTPRDGLPKNHFGGA